MNVLSSSKHFLTLRLNLLFFRYKPYNPDPEQLKKKTDRSKELLQEINSVKLDETKMKPREVKALAQVLID